jgi:8-hydroxy-5-deazaflavin:NADPH oxidoreductase
MNASPTLTIGMLGAGTIAQAIAPHALRAGHRVILANSRGPETLGDVVGALGDGATAGDLAEAAAADVVFLTVPWTAVPEVAAAVPDWSGRIVVDATNQFESVSPLVVADLGDGTGSERNAELLAGARIVKAFNTLYGRYTAQDPRHAEGRLVVFLAGDDPDAKGTVAGLVEGFGFAPVDLGGLRDAGRLMQVGGGPLSGLHLIKLA